jgi:hypothetical protein
MALTALAFAYVAPLFDRDRRSDGRNAIRLALPMAVMG